MALDLGAVMSAIAARLTGAITGLRVYDYSADNAQPPAAIVSLASLVEYDVVAGRGCDRCVIPVTLLVGRVSERTARATLAGYIAGTGPTSIKAAIEGTDPTLGGVAQTVRVTGATIDVVTIAGVEYLGASFEVEVYD